MEFKTSVTLLLAMLKEDRDENLAASLTPMGAASQYTIDEAIAVLESMLQRGITEISVKPAQIH